MLTLLLLRHAKAVPLAGGDDFNRVLTDRGHADAARLGAYLYDQRLVPDAALVSAAVRTRETMESLQATAQYPIATVFDAFLYNATERQIRDRIATTDPGVRTLMIVGHNPGVMELAQRLAQSGDLADFDAMRSHFPPCSLVVLAFDRDSWDDVRDGGGRLDLFVTPDRLRS